MEVVNMSTYFARLRELMALELQEERERYRRSFEERGLSLSGTIIREATCTTPSRWATLHTMPLAS